MNTVKRAFFTVGPSQLYPGLPQLIKKALATGIGSVSHRSDQFRLIYHNTKDELFRLLNIPEDFQLFFLGSSIEIMEKIITSCVDKISLHLISGDFAEKWQQTAVNQGKNAYKIIYGQSGFNPDKLKLPADTELVCLTQNETSTGVSVPEKIIQRIKKLWPEKLLAVDVVSSIPYVNLNWKTVDLVFFSVQKGFGLPAGLAILLANNQSILKAKKLSINNRVRPGFHNLVNLAEKANDWQTPETPNVLGIYLLGEVARKMRQKGINQIRRETKLKAELIYQQIKIPASQWQSKTTIVIETRFPSEHLINALLTKGFVVSNGYGENKGKQIRIANFPAHSLPKIKSLCKYLNLWLK